VRSLGAARLTSISPGVSLILQVACLCHAATGPTGMATYFSLARPFHPLSRASQQVNLTHLLCLTPTLQASQSVTPRTSINVTMHQSGGEILSPTSRFYSLSPIYPLTYCHKRHCRVDCSDKCEDWSASSDDHKDHHDSEDPDSKIHPSLDWKPRIGTGRVLPTIFHPPSVASPLEVFSYQRPFQPAIVR
jgi:hypothetical protein